MPAYVIADVSVSDPERYKFYAAPSPAAVAAGGGRFLVPAGATERFDMIVLDIVARETFA